MQHGKRNGNGNMQWLYDKVTSTIVEALEHGTAPWVKPWSNGATGRYRNPVTGTIYKGINIMLLNIESMARGYTSREWLTMKNANKWGGKVRKGESPTYVVYWKIIEKETNNEETKETETKTIPLLRYWKVFNREQLDLPATAPEDQSLNPDHSNGDRSEYPEAEHLLNSTGATILHDNSGARYSPLTDTITLPHKETFIDNGAYYATALHELAHWTGHESRLNRPILNRFGSPEYAIEELVAELASAYLSEYCQLDGMLQHPEYIAHWIKVLREDSRAIFKVDSQAKRATTYVLDSAHVETAP